MKTSIKYKILHYIKLLLVFLGLSLFSILIAREFNQGNLSKGLSSFIVGCSFLLTFVLEILELRFISSCIKRSTENIDKDLLELEKEYLTEEVKKLHLPINEAIKKLKNEIKFEENKLYFDSILEETDEKKKTEQTGALD